MIVRAPAYLAAILVLAAMKALKHLLCILALAASCIAQDIKLKMPLKGTAGKDFFIDYFVDHDTTDGTLDVFCGTKTYNGHQGTDFLLRSYKSMDSGVYVYAAADGRVFETKDGMYDRSKHWLSGGLGNHVGIIHKNSICTWYGHMMKYSILVKIGDSVKVGQPIGKVGSSGYSSYPHLHFEVRDKDRHIIDPFSGHCSAGSPSYWVSQPPYDTSLFVINTGFVPYKPGLDTLQEGYLVSDTFSITKDTVVCFWALMHGMRKGNVLRAEWYTPDNNLYFHASWNWNFNWWHDYTWATLNMPKTKGRWAILFYVNDKFVASRHFYEVKRRD